MVVEPESLNYLDQAVVFRLLSFLGYAWVHCFQSLASFLMVKSCLSFHVMLICVMN